VWLQYMVTDVSGQKTGLSLRRLNSDPLWRQIRELHAQRFDSDAPKSRRP
jgi:hypothetical protein